MDKTKSDSIFPVICCSDRFRVTPELKEELREIAESQHRSMSNLIELIIRQYIDEHKKTEE